MNDLQSYVASRHGMVSKLESTRAAYCSSGFSRRLVKCVLTFVSLPVVIVAAGPAHGDSEGDSSAAVDTSFVAALNAAGITYTNAGKAITAGQTVCDLVDQGKAGKELVATLQKHNESLTTERARRFMAIALHTYCPQNLARGMKNASPQEEKREQQEEEELASWPWPG